MTQPTATILAIDDSPTILRVLQTLLSKDGYAVHVAEDGEEGARLAGELRPDLILLDFLMPGMNGYQVCRALGEREETRAIPVVLMSAKADQVGDRFVKVMGIADYLAKPFSAHELRAVVARALERSAGVSAHASPTENADEVGGGGADRAPEHTPDHAPDHAIDPGTDPERPSARRRDDDTHRVYVSPSGQVTRDRARAHDDPRPALAGDEEEPVLAGDLAHVPLAGVLQLLADQRHTGMLAIARADTVIEIALRAGRIDYAGADHLGDDFLLGRYLVEHEAIAPADLERFFASRAPTDALFGEELVQLGQLLPEELAAALRRQTSERVLEALRWPAGRFALRATADLGPRAEGAALRLSVDELLLRARGRIDEWHLLDREALDLDVVYLRDEEALARLAPDQLARDERTVIDLVNAKNSVRDIVRQSRLAQLEVSQALFRLRTVRLIRRRVQPVPL